jgi:hypothetical protein
VKWLIKRRGPPGLDIAAFGDPFGSKKCLMQKNTLFGVLVTKFYPTKANLCSRKVTMDSCCPICEREEETAYHPLWQCPAARDVWSAGSVKFQKSCHGGPTFLQVAEGMVSSCDQTELAYFVSIARRIWLRRNEKIHGDGFLHPNIIVQQATQAVDLFLLVGDLAVL